jgi:hypothetical protein
VLLIDRSIHIDSGVGAPIYPVGLALRSDHAEVRAKVECDLLKDLTASRLLRPIILIL